MRSRVAVAALLPLVIACGSRSHGASLGDFVGRFFVASVAGSEPRVGRIDLFDSGLEYSSVAGPRSTKLDVSLGYRFAVFDGEVSVFQGESLEGRGAIDFGEVVVHQICVLSPGRAYVAMGPTNEVPVFAPETLEILEPIDLSSFRISDRLDVFGCGVDSGLVYFVTDRFVLAFDPQAGGIVDADPSTPAVDGIPFAANPCVPGMTIDPSAHTGYGMALGPGVLGGIAALDLASYADSAIPALVVSGRSFGSEGRSSSFFLGQTSIVVVVGDGPAGRTDAVHWYTKEGELRREFAASDAVRLSSVAAASPGDRVLARVLLDDAGAAFQVLDPDASLPLWPRAQAVGAADEFVVALAPWED